jgi:hypothetical protein
MQPDQRNGANINQFFLPLYNLHKHDFKAFIILIFLFEINLLYNDFWHVLIENDDV